MTQHKAASMSASEAAAHYKATQAATRKIQGTESIGGGYTATGGKEFDGDKYIEAMKQGYRNIYDKQKAMRGKLSGLQKSWVLNYIEGATGHLEFSDKPGKCEIKQCHVFFQTMEAIEAGNLPASFTEAQLLQWADGAGLMLTAAGLDAWRRITQEANTKAADTPAASDTGKAGAMVDTDASPKADGNKHGKRKPKQGAVTGIAAKVGVSTWQGIRLEVDADIVRVNGEIDLTYGDLGIMRGARKGEPNRQRRLLILIAAASDKPYIPVDDSLYAGAAGLDNFSVHLTRLNNALKKTFGIRTNPIAQNGTGEVETLFTIQAAGDDSTDAGGAAHVAKDKAAGRRKHQKFSTLAEADMAREAIEAKAREKSRY